jgi:hypothetical protein
VTPTPSACAPLSALRVRCSADTGAQAAGRRAPRGGALTLGLVAALLLTGCGDDPANDPANNAVPAPTPSATTTSTLAPTATPTATASVVPPSVPATTPATRGPARDGDVDGDGREDRVTATQDLLTVVLTSGRTLTAPVTADTEPPVQGVVDVDRDGRAEVFLETTRGASTAFYTPFRFDGTTLAALQLGGEPALLGVGGTVTHGEGFACAKGVLTVASSTSEDGEGFDVTTTTYAVRGFALQQSGRAVARGLAQGDPRVAASYQVDCGSVTQDG